MQTRRIALSDIEIECDEVPGPGRPFVMLHGFTGHRSDFRPRLPELTDEGWLLAPDLRGHGDSTHTGRDETFRFERLVADLAALLDRVAAPRCDLLGHSFGGMLALRFVLAHPERVASLVLMDTAPFVPREFTGGPLEKAGAIARARGMRFLQELVEKAARANSAPSASERQTEKWADRYWSHQRMRYAAMDPVAYAELGRAMLYQQSVVPRLAEIRCTTTILVGDCDVEFLEGADALEKGIPGAVRVTLPDAGHHPQIESPAAWLDAVRGHLRRARGAEGPVPGAAAERR